MRAAGGRSSIASRSCGRMRSSSARFARPNARAHDTPASRPRRIPFLASAETRRRHAVGGVDRSRAFQVSRYVHIVREPIGSAGACAASFTTRRGTPSAWTIENGCDSPSWGISTTACPCSDGGPPATSTSPRPNPASIPPLGMVLPRRECNVMSVRCDGTGSGATGSTQP